jgi:hypothetical protein
MTEETGKALAFCGLLKAEETCPPTLPSRRFLILLLLLNNQQTQQAEIVHFLSGGDLLFW